ncbi:MAG: isocitrate lyase/PEP mutase family protein [Rhodospirillaceae bacterium]|nr:isocitrate lyase/PEP mutase family protein [Rhodospirillaceae bacterium]
MIGPAETLKRLLAGGETIAFPTCHDALSAKLTRDAGFAMSFMSGFAVAATRLGMPDTGLITFSEMLDQLRNICNAVPGFPIVGDGDTGYGNAMNVRRTVFDYARAGAACVMIEDQLTPKKCGHFDGKQVVSRSEARLKIRAAVEAAREAGILVLARTDARAVEGFDAAIARCRDFEEEGADIVFLEAPISQDELRDYAKAMRQPTMANMAPGSKTPMVPRAELAAMGIRLIAYHPLLFSAVKAMADALAALRADDAAKAPPVVGFDAVKGIVGLPDYEKMQARYAAE